MDYAYTLDYLQDIVKEHAMVLLYFSRQENSESLELLNRVDRLVSRYPKMVGLHVDLGQIPTAASRFSIYALPGVVVYVNGKPAINVVQNIDLTELASHLTAFYRSVFFPA